MKPINVLIVEDSEGDAFLISQVAEEYPAPIRIHIASDGEQALKLLTDRRYKPDLIILDLNLPKVLGDDVLARYHPRLAPVVVFTSYRNETSERLALELGASEVVAKPINLSEYVRAVHNMLRRWLPQTSEMPA